jgi:ABC-2 type transport system permease protein
MMRGFLSVFKRELRGYFSTPLAYVFLVIFLFGASFMTFNNGFFEMRQASLVTFFNNIPMLFIFLVPAIAMRLWAEERRTNSVELLFSMPLTMTQAVLGKYFAALTVIALALLLTFPMVITVYYLGSPDPGPIVSGYLGCLLLAAAYLAIGSFFSSVTRNQVIAFVLALVACALFLYAGSPSVLAAISHLHIGSHAMPMGVIEAVESLSFQLRFDSMLRGVIEARDVTFFVVLGAGWLIANIVSLKERIAAA